MIWGQVQFKVLTPVVQKVDNAIHRINHYPLDGAIGFPNSYPWDSAIHLLNNWGQINNCPLDKSVLGKPIALSSR